VVSLLLAWLLLGLLAVALRRGPIENDLAARASAAVHRSGAARADATVAGTAVTLHGAFGSPAAAEAALRAAHVNGVSSVRLGADAVVAAGPAATGTAAAAPRTAGSAAPATAEPLVAAAASPATPGPVGSPAPTAAPRIPGAAADDTARAALDAAMADHPIRFAFGTTVLSGAAAAGLGAVADVLRSGTFAVVVGGHTDSLGDASVNQALSLARAESVVRDLVARGVPAARLLAVGYGASRPVADNATALGRAANRRVEITAGPAA
jgi:outer membrane protein OmpA-like peptidoglycan-associated protein